MKNRYPDDRWQEILGACDTTIFLGCTDMLTAEYFSDRIGISSVEVEGTMRELNTLRLTNYTPTFRETNALGRRQLMTPDEILRLKPDEELVFVRGQKVYRAHRFDYSQHIAYKKLKNTKSIYHEPNWQYARRASAIEPESMQLANLIEEDESILDALNPTAPDEEEIPIEFSKPISIDETMK